MGKIRKKKNKFKSLKKSFIFAVLYTVIIIVVLSGATIIGCIGIQKHLVPNSNQIYITTTANYRDGADEKVIVKAEIGGTGYGISAALGPNYPTVFRDGAYRLDYDVKKIENSYSKLSEKEKIIYSCSRVAMVALPVIYSIIGIIVCGLWFFKKKLEKPINILAKATDNISKQNLDFEVKYNSNNEMGKLCESFEKMREELAENNRQMWNMLEERKKLQASIAHDLRNPISIIEGNAEYIQLNIQDGNIDNEQLQKIAENIFESAKRMEAYTDSIRDINKLEELKVNKEEKNLHEMLNKMAYSFQAVGRYGNIRVDVENNVPEYKALIDEQVIYRIAENLFTNAMRYAWENICLKFDLNEDKLMIIIADDGPGFPKEILSSRERYIYMADKSGKHMGMGLAISNILCKKHNGELVLENSSDGGAIAKIVIKI